MPTLTPKLGLNLPADFEANWGEQYRQNFTTLDNAWLTPNVSGAGFVTVITGSLGTITISGADTGINDHGALSGLLDDDHPQYALVNGTRAFTAPVSGVTPTTTAQLATKGYVDTRDVTVSGYLQGQIDGKSASNHTHDASVLTSGTIPNARIAASSVIQHQGALTHSGIAGLSADDHPQYFNAARGNATYLYKALVGAGKVTVTSGTTEVTISGALTLPNEIDHGGLLGLDDHDHPNYPHKLLNETVSGTWNFLNGVTVSGFSVNTNNDHGGLSGLTDDDHTQYLLVNGTRSMTGNLSFSSPLSTIAGIPNQNLVDLNANETISGTWNFSTGAGLTVSGVPVALSTFAGLIETYSGHIETPGSGTTYYLEHKAAYPMSIKTLSGQTDVGSLSVTVRVNSTAVTGLDSVTLNTVDASHTATSNNAVAIGDTIKLVVNTAPANANDFRFTLKTQRT